VATETAELTVAVDLLVEKLEHQLRKHKEKLLDRHRVTGHRFDEVAPAKEAEENADE
jgi:ribosome-associated translation inhibitor RaiA